MAEVFHGTVRGAEGFARPVAIKRIQPSLSAIPTFADMFVNEARLASLLHHPNICSVLDFDRDEQGSFFLVMELVQGVDLHEVVPKGRLPFAISAFIVAEVLEGLAYAHELVHNGKHLRIVHRDVSPHNVMLTWDGNVKLVDFGIAKAVAATGASRTGSLKGKIGYMSPEQAHAQELDGRSDVFGVGVMFHELLTGRRLFQGATEPETLARLLTSPIPSPRELRGDVPRDLAKVCMRMLERERDRRHASARAALEDLLHCPSMSARASLDLEALLSSRFPGRAPKQRVSAPRSAQPGPSAQIRGTAPTVPLGGKRTQSLNDAATPAARGERPSVPEESSSRAWVWIAGALLASAAAIGVALYVTGRNEAASKNEVRAPVVATPAPAATIDAAAAVVTPLPPPVDATVKTVVPVDAGPPATESKPTKPSERSRHRVRSRDRDRHRDKNKKPGRLSVYVDPWANVYVRGKFVKQTPLTGHTLPPGIYRIRLVYPDGNKSETVPVTIRSGRGTVVRRDWSF